MVTEAPPRPKPAVIEEWPVAPAKPSPSDKTITVNVEQRHIDEGECGQPGKCAVALALEEMFPGYRTSVSVLEVRLAQYEEGSISKGYDFTHGMREWIEAFDRGDAVKPCKIELHLEAEKNIGRSWSHT